MKKSDLRYMIREVIEKKISELKIARSWRSGGESEDLGKFSKEAERITNESKNASEEELKKKDLSKVFVTQAGYDEEIDYNIDFLVVSKDEIDEWIKNDDFKDP